MKEIISAQELKRHKSDHLIIDVRTPDEFLGELGHIDGAVLIPLDQFQQELEQLDPSQKVVLVCRSGRRSEFAADLLKQKGFSFAKSLDGGMMQWNALGYEVIK